MGRAEATFNSARGPGDWGGAPFADQLPTVSPEWAGGPGYEITG